MLVYHRERPGSQVRLPRGNGGGFPVGGIATPHALDQVRGGLPPAGEVLLPVLLLYLQGETGTEDALKETIRVKFVSIPVVPQTSEILRTLDC